MPHLSRHIGPISREYVENIAMLVIAGIAYATYAFHRRAEARLQTSQQKLLKSFEYIGTVNRKLPFLKYVSTELLGYRRLTKKDKRKVFDDLLRIAVVSVARAKCGMFRFVDVRTQKTVKEFMYSSATNEVILPFGNKDLFVAHEYSKGAHMLPRNCQAIVASDRSASVKSFLILPMPETQQLKEYELLQAITDQAQLFYKYVFE